MPQRAFDASMVAPCGMNCAVCYKHLGKKPCPGCQAQSGTQPPHCRACGIKACAAQKGVRHCWACSEFPCKPVKALDKSYRMRYGQSLIANSEMAKALGVEEFQARQRQKYRCPACGGVVSLHDGICSNCKAQYPMGRRSVTK